MRRHVERPSKVIIAFVVLVGAISVVSVTGALAVNPGSGKTKTGQALSIRIDTPVNGAQVPAQDLNVSGLAGVGVLGGTAGTNVIYLVDKSGSTSSSAPVCGTVLNCEIQGVLALNRSLTATSVQTGVIAFGDQADLADMSPSAGQQDFTAAGSVDPATGKTNVEEVASSITESGVGKYTSYTTSGGGTNFDNAIARINTAFASHSGQRNIAEFLSDGSSSINTAAGGPLDQARAAGTRINTFAIGSGTEGCSVGQSLRTIADTTGGACTAVADPSQLSAAISGGTAAGLKSVGLLVDGRTAVAATVSGIGNWTATIPAAALKPGSHRIVATATATDGSQASADITVTVGGAEPKVNPKVAIGLPGNKKCISKRMFKITIRQLPRVTYDFAMVYVNGQRVKVYVHLAKRWILTGRPSGTVLNVKRFTALVDLRGLPKGRYTTRILVVTVGGQILVGTRKYRTCTRKLKGGVPRL